MDLLSWLRNTDRRLVVYWVSYLSAGLLVWQIFAVWVPARQYQQRTALARQHLHAVQLALERFAVDSPAGNYPQDIHELAVAGYLPEFPTNPFTGEPMHPLSLEETSRAGDFRYHPNSGYGNDQGPPVSYELELFY